MCPAWWTQWPRRFSICFHPGMEVSACKCQPHTLHSLAFLREPGKRALGFSGVEIVNSFPRGGREEGRAGLPHCPSAAWCCFSLRKLIQAKANCSLQLLPACQWRVPQGKWGRTPIFPLLFSLNIPSLRDILHTGPLLCSLLLLWLLASKYVAIFIPFYNVEKYFKYRTVQKIIKPMTLTPRINRCQKFVIFVSDVF